MNMTRIQWEVQQTYLVWITVAVEWRNHSGSARVILVPSNSGHPPFQSGIVDCFWIDPSHILSPAVQPHAMAPELKRLDTMPKKNLQEIHTRHSLPNQLNYTLHQHLHVSFLLRNHLQRGGLVHSAHGELRESTRLPRCRLILAVERGRLPASD